MGELEPGRPLGRTQGKRCEPTLIARLLPVQTKVVRAASRARQAVLRLPRSEDSRLRPGACRKRPGGGWIQRGSRAGGRSR
jgi:hypothetical protein